MFPIDRFVAAVERRHRSIVVCAVILLALSGLSFARLRLDMDLLAQLPARSEVFRDYRRVLEDFGARDTLFILVGGPEARIVAFAGALTEKLRAIPGIGSVRDRVDAEGMHRDWLRPHRWQLLDEEGYAELAGRLSAEAVDGRIAGLRRALTMPMSVGARRWIVEDPLGIDEIVARSLERRYGDPLLRPSGERLLAPSRDALLVLVRPDRSAFDTVFGERLMAAVRAAETDLLAGTFAGDGVRVGHTGSYVYALADRAILERDFRIYFLFVPLAVLAVLHLGLRTLRVLPFVTFPLVVTTMVTFVLSQLFFGSLNMVSVAFAAIFYGLGVDSSIYFYAVLRASTRDVADRAALRAAVAATLREIGAANLVASTTTAAAFLVVGFSDFTGVSQLGLLTAVAMLLNVAGTFVLLPAMVFAWGPRALPRAALPGQAVARAYASLASRLAERRGAVLASAAIVVAVTAPGILRARLETDFMRLQPAGGEAAEVEREIGERFGRAGAQAMAVVRAANLETALAASERVAGRLEVYRKEGQVAAYSTIGTFLPSRATAERRLERFRALPRERAAADIERALERHGFDQAAFHPFLEEWKRAAATAMDPASPVLTPLREQHVRQKHGEVDAATWFQPAPGASLAAIRDRLGADLDGMDLVVTGREIAEREFARLLGREVVVFLFGALALNLMLVFAAERSLARTLRLLVPTLAALWVTVGLAGFAGIRLDPVNVIVLPLVIGLGVDGTVYLAAHVRYRGRLDEGCARGVLPLVLAVATTVVGFGSLALSRFPALGRLGVLAATGLVLSALATLVLVPALLGKAEGEERARGARRSLGASC